MSAYFFTSSTARPRGTCGACVGQQPEIGGTDAPDNLGAFCQRVYEVASRGAERLERKHKAIPAHYLPRPGACAQTALWHFGAHALAALAEPLPSTIGACRRSCFARFDAARTNSRVLPHSPQPLSILYLPGMKPLKHLIL